MFELGQVVATANFESTLGKEASIREARKSLVRHASCDWGDCCDGDKKSNDDALKAGERLLSVYHTDDGIKFWIITERDRSVTTILLPEDY